MRADMLFWGAVIGVFYMLWAIAEIPSVGGAG